MIIYIECTSVEGRAPEAECKKSSFHTISPCFSLHKMLKYASTTESCEVYFQSTFSRPALRQWFPMKWAYK